jgi:hypothetical protein
VPVYEIYGRGLRSSMPLPELSPIAAEPQLTFTRARLDDPEGEWFEIWPEPDGRPWIRAMRLSSGYAVQYVNLAEFHIDRDGRDIVCDTAPECSDDMVRHFLLDQIVPLALSLHSPVLHASCVLVNGEMAAFVGPGGAGKSTLAFALGRAGHPIGSDDGLLLRLEASRVLGTPAYPGARLWRDSAQALAAGPPLNPGARQATKLRFREGLPFFMHTAPLTRLYVVDPQPAADARFEPLSRRTALMEVVQQAYRLALDDRASLARQFDVLARTVMHVPAWRVSFPRALDAWQPLAGAVALHISRGTEAVAV